MTSDDNCIFCKIIKGEIPCAKVYEDGHTFAFLDIAPNNPGHTLVVSKAHFETMLDIPEQELNDLIQSVKKVAGAVRTATGSMGFNVIQNNFKVAGQLVPHIHFHIIPRREDDGFKFWPQGKYAEGEMDAMQKKVRDALENPRD